MEVTTVSQQGGKVRLQIDININGPLLEVEERIQQAVNCVGSEATRLALEQFDTDGSPVMTGPIKWTRDISIRQARAEQHSNAAIGGTAARLAMGRKTVNLSPEPL